MFDFIKKSIKLGAKPIVSYMFGHPFNTMEETELKMKELLEMHRTGARVSLYGHTAFPGTKARVDLKKYILENCLEDWDKYDTMFWSLYDYKDQRVGEWILKTGQMFRKLLEGGYKGNAKLVAALYNLDRNKLDVPNDLSRELMAVKKLI